MTIYRAQIYKTEHQIIVEAMSALEDGTPLSHYMQGFEFNTNQELDLQARLALISVGCDEPEIVTVEDMR